MPLTDQAEESLRNGDIPSTDGFRVLPIEADVATCLFVIKIAQRLCSACGILMDQYEDDLVEPGKCPCLRRASEPELERLDPTSTLYLFLVDLSKLLQVAALHGRPVLFCL